MRSYKSSRVPLTVKGMCNIYLLVQLMLLFLSPPPGIKFCSGDNNEATSSSLPRSSLNIYAVQEGYDG